jgi:hypothetical protein|tara:strand:- start:354 stop:671 length:318 start_codon:yes stop_codon:yes gene_type:complete
MKCEQGDLAKVVHSVRPENIGKIVLVKEYIGKYKQNDTFDFRGVSCMCPVTDHYWWIEATGLKNQFGDSPKAYIADSWLEPIRPETGKKSATHVVKDKEVERQAA